MVGKKRWKRKREFIETWEINQARSIRLAKLEEESTIETRMRKREFLLKLELAVPSTFSAIRIGDRKTLLLTIALEMSTDPEPELQGTQLAMFCVQNYNFSPWMITTTAEGGNENDE